MPNKSHALNLYSSDGTESYKTTVSGTDVTQSSSLAKTFVGPAFNIHKVNGSGTVVSQIDDVVGSFNTIQSELQAERTRIDNILASANVDTDTFAEMRQYVETADADVIASVSTNASAITTLQARLDELTNDPN